MWWAEQALSVALGSVLVLAIPIGAQEANAVASAYGHNRTLVAYTFTLNGSMRMHHFPWLSFRIAGRGVYIRGVRYEANLTGLPFFAKGFSRIDLTPLAPSMWRRHYIVMASHLQADGTQAYVLRDPSDKTLREATAYVDPVRGIREVDMTYSNGGEINLFVTCTRIGTYLLPASASARINVPSEALSVDAEFTKYKLPKG